MGPRALKAVSMLLRVLQLILSLFIVGVASYHTWQFAHEHILLTNDSRGQLPRALYAILVISAVAALYSFFTLITTCLGHKKFFMFALVSDLLFTGGFVGISILMRGSAKQKCNGAQYAGAISKNTNNLPSALYSGIVRNSRARNPRLLCNLDKAVFSLAVALSVFFALTLLLSYLALKAYRQNRAFGPSPGNNYSTRNTGTHKSWANPFHRASEETAYTTNTAVTGTTVGGGSSGGGGGGGGGGTYDTPGVVESGTGGAAAYRAPPPAGSHVQQQQPVGGLVEGDKMNGRFDPSLPHRGGHSAHSAAPQVDQRYAERGYGNQNF